MGSKYLFPNSSSSRRNLTWEAQLYWIKLYCKEDSCRKELEKMVQIVLGQRAIPKMNIVHVAFFCYHDDFVDHVSKELLVLYLRL